jgi:hypothetical protein
VEAEGGEVGESPSLGVGKSMLEGRWGEVLTGCTEQRGHRGRNGASERAPEREC